MAFIIKTDLFISLYPEIIDEIIRKSILSFANQAAFPTTGILSYLYQDQSNSNLFTWSGTSYIPASDPDLIITRCINSATAEAKSYLGKYNTTILFDGITLDPTITEFLKSITIDLACWKLIRLANPNIDLKLFRTSYEDAINWLKGVQEGDIVPDGFPYQEDDPSTPEDEAIGQVAWSSNRKRRQSF